MDIGRSIEEIDAKVRQLDQALKSSTSSTRDLDKALKIDPTNTEAVAAKMKALQGQIGTAAQKLSLLKQKQLEARDAFESNKITEAEFDKVNLAVIKAEAQLQGFNQELKKTKTATNEANLKSIASGFDNVTNALNKTKAMMSSLSKVALGVMGALTGIVYTFAKTGDELNTISKKYRITTEELQLQRNLYGKVTGDAGNYEAALASLGSIMTSIARGRGAQYIETLEKLGVATTNADGSARDIGAVYDEIFAALQQVTDETERAALAMMLFGDNGLNVSSLAELSKDEILALNEAMIENGLISTEQAEQAAELQNQMNDLKMQFAAAAAELAVALMPAIQALTEFLKTAVIPVINTIARWFAGLSPEQQKMLMWLLMLVIILPKLIAIITTIIGVVKAITVALYGTAGATGAVSAAATPLIPIMWAVAAVVLILVLLFAALAGKSSDVTSQLKQQQDQMRSMQNEFSDMGADFEVTSSQVSQNYNTDKLEIHVQIDAYGETQMSQENAELVADILAERINKQLGGKI